MKKKNTWSKGLPTYNAYCKTCGHGWIVKTSQVSTKCPKCSDQVVLKGVKK